MGCPGAKAGSPVVNYAMDFDDVDEDQWYTEAVRWAVSKGIVAGTQLGRIPEKGVRPGRSARSA